MPRLHLFEFEDQKWFPSLIRNFMTDFLQFVSNQFNMYRPIVPLLKKGIEKGDGQTWIDLASGGGGGLLNISRDVKQEMPKLNITLTDYYPNIPAFERTVKVGGNHFRFERESVNALEVPAELKGFRTQFLSFHHFKPNQARQVLQNAVDAGQPIGIFEAQERSVKHFIMFFFSPINVLISTPFIRPFSWGRLLFTYLIPLVPLFVWWDGLVSVLRTYSVKEMKGLVSELKDGDSFEWEVAVMKNKGVSIPYILGFPRG